MKTFPNWRAVGRTLRWARQQDGVTVERSRDEQSGERVITWSLETDYIVIAFDGDTYQFGVDTESNWLTDGHFESAGAALRILAALHLIPAELAEPDPLDVACPGCGAPPRVGCLSVITGLPRPARHRQHRVRQLAAANEPEVQPSGQATGSLCRCTWLGIGTPEHERSGLCLPEAGR